MTEATMGENESLCIAFCEQISTLPGIACVWDCPPPFFSLPQGILNSATDINYLSFEK